MKNLILGFTAVCSIACHEKQTKHSGAENKLQEVALDHEKDPVCDMPVSETVSDTLVFKGSIYGFCSKDCKLKFSNKPELYISK